jgi:Leucine-rich repeat (LRR) protein
MQKGFGFFRVIGAVCIAAGMAFGQTDITDKFEDANFLNIVRRMLNLGDTAIIYKEDVENITDILSVSGAGITSLAGIEYFTALEGLICQNNQLTSLDLSKNTALTELSCYNNQLTSLDLTTNTKMTNLHVINNYMSDISKVIGFAIAPNNFYPQNTPNAPRPEVSTNVANSDFNWEATADTYGSTASYEADANKVSFSVNLKTSGGGKWVWGGISTAPEADWSDFWGIDITYSCNRDVIITLNTKDQQLSDGGATFRYTLTAGTNKSVSISLNDFKQPSWVNSSSQYYRASVDKSLLEGIGISATVEGTTTTGTINNLALVGMTIAGQVVIVTDAESPIITQHPESDTATVGKAFSLSVLAFVSDSINGRLSYQWFRNDSLITGATAATYSVPTTAIATYNYKVVVTNTDNSVNGKNTAQTASNTATVVVAAPKKAEYDMSGITFASQRFVYDGVTTRRISISGVLPEGVSVSYVGINEDYSANGRINVGIDTVVAIFTTTNPNYNAPSSKLGILEIYRSENDITLSFVDSVFRQMVYKKIGKSHPVPIYKTDVDTITRLDLRRPKAREIAEPITSLKGIEYFKALKYLDVNGNDIEKIDLSSNTSLEHLDIGGNQISEIDLSNNINLETLDISDNKITQIDLSNNVNLETLEVGGNKLASLNDIKGLDNTKIDEKTFDMGEQKPTPIYNTQKSDGRTGIRLSKNIVSDKAEFYVILPNDDKVLEVKAVIYDNVGNVVFEKVERGAKLSWNLTNIAGRNVANGSYLIVAQARGAKGTYAYSAKVGVKR